MLPDGDKLKVKSILECGGSYRTGWDELCAFLSSYPNDGNLEQLIELTLKEIKEFPDYCKVAPDQWIEDCVVKREPRLKLVDDIALKNANIDDDFVVKLANSQDVKHISSLRVSGCGDRGVDAIATSPYLNNLKNLSLSSSKVSAAGVASIANSSNFSNLVELSLSKTAIGDPGVVELAKSKKLPHLSSLSLSQCNLTGNALEALFRSSLLSTLSHLNLEDNKLTCFNFLEDNSLVSKIRLKSFNLSKNLISSDDIGFLSRSKILKKVEYLNLSHNPIDNSGFKYLADSSYISKISELYLDSTGIRDEGLQAIAGSPNFKSGLLLSVGDTWLSIKYEDILKEAGFKEYRNGGYWQRFRRRK